MVAAGLLMGGGAVAVADPGSSGSAAHGWPHDTAIAVAGLLRYRHIPGAWALAEQLATGLLDAAHAFGARLPERLLLRAPRTQFGSPVPYPSSCSPQLGQCRTAVAVALVPRSTRMYPSAG